ncbi:Acyl-CoA synthetase (AMP-forming)/AMP-acid ligase II [Streptomyces sp. yr375]|uniref:class I adenylate-forming enzyme family protein n=1 Tax=Streptomyces sp. yr375 TaxID=1761906 RepID=UPI0008AF8597|nr:class I adenylate-forming enzyme family protein [Streptomyces sp. yr375]SER66697.1 Acyl-CoA synthetase (AMP-forming)/AMP-acid ligase II [Streptomyces sp. yr375]
MGEHLPVPGTDDNGDDGMGPLLRRLLEAQDDRLPYLNHRQETVTRGELRERVAKQAAVFAGYGIGPASTVGLRTPPSFTQVEVLLALWRLGAQVLLFDFRLKPAEVAALCASCRPQFMVSAGTNVQATFGFRSECEVVTERQGGGRPAGTDHRLVQFSSGSTGRPKVIGRTARSLAAEVDRFTRIPGMPGPGDKLLLLSSTAHSFGLVAGLLHSLAAGVSVVFAPRISARDILRTAVDHQITALFGVPMHYELLAAAIDPPALPDLRVAVSGGELMPPAVAARFTERYGVNVGESYGTTETGVVAMDTGGTLRPAVGRAAPGVVLREHQGELDVALDQSPYLFDTGGGQYADGWLHTRDRATTDAAGAVTVHGRADSLVVIGGLKVDLVEVENVLRDHPAVEQAVLVHEGVTEAYVSVTAGAGQPTAEELLRWCRERLADYKLPRVIRLLDTLPRTSNGKLLRQAAALQAAATDGA